MCVTCRACEAVSVCYPPARGLAAIPCPPALAAAAAAPSPAVAGMVSRWYLSGVRCPVSRRCPAGVPLVSRWCPPGVLKHEIDFEIDFDIENEIEYDNAIEIEI